MKSSTLSMAPSSQSTLIMHPIFANVPAWAFIEDAPSVYEKLRTPQPSSTRLGSASSANSTSIFAVKAGFVRSMFPIESVSWELSTEDRRELGYDFLVPASCAALNATAVKPPKIIESSEGRRARRAARLAKARRRKPPVPTKERVPKWVHVVEE